MSESIRRSYKEVKMTKAENVVELTVADIEATKEKFQLDRMQILHETPFYGMLLLELEVLAQGPDFPALGGVNYRSLSLRAAHPQDSVYSRLSDRGRKTLLVHEILHIVFEHLSIPRSFDSNIANIAADAVINRIISRDSGLSLGDLPAGIVTPLGDSITKSGFTVGTGSAKQTFLIDDFETKDWLPIYWDIYHSLEQEGKAAGCTPSELADYIRKRAKELSDLNPLGNSVDTTDDGDSPEYQQNRIRWRQKVITALDIQKKQQGDVPAELERFIATWTDSKIKWTTYLRRLLKTEISRDDFKYKVVSRRAHLQFGGKRRPPIYPKIESDALGDVFLVLDTSGSMSVDDLRDGISELRGVRQATPFKLFFFSCDAQVYKVAIYDRHESPDWSTMPVIGGGGTDFRPAFQLIDQYRKQQKAKPALVVFFTDTCGYFPEEEPSYPVIWVTNYPNASVPWGTLVSVED